MPLPSRAIRSLRAVVEQSTGTARGDNRAGPRIAGGWRGLAMAKSTAKSRAKAPKPEAHEADQAATKAQAATGVPMPRKAYEAELARLQVELAKLQEWVRAQGLRVVVIFEGRDAA